MRSCPDFGSGCCTASCPPAAKEKVMAAFRAGTVDVLVATTVIEVGVDVPDRIGDGDRGR